MIILRDQMICKSEKMPFRQRQLKFHKAVFIFPGKSYIYSPMPKGILPSLCLLLAFPIK